jgi:hypothetical protein
MLVIRAAQMAAFQQDDIDRFKFRLQQHLITFLPSKGVHLTEQILHKEIDTGMSQIGQFGLNRECDVARLFELVYGSGHTFGAGLPKDAMNILWAYRVDPLLKLTRLQAWVESLPRER